MELGVCYYPEHWPESEWPRDAEKMHALGIKKVRMGEFAWALFEPALGALHWDWMRRAMDVLHAQGLQVILGTPTACPPKWLVDAHPEILPRDAQGQVRGFGSRRHYCFSSQVYRHHCERIVTAMACALGDHPALVAWQTDNEYGCHDTIFSYGPTARAAFQQWCRERYDTIDALNQAWGNVFWSMRYPDFESIDPPRGAVTELNPAHRMAYWHFHSDQVASFNRLQVDILRQHSPDRDILHNYMGRTTSFDHHRVGRDLDIATWDSYPLGFLDQSQADDGHKARYLRTGDPDFTAFHHDLYRGVGRGRWWVMEQQPGPVNWAPHNPAPLPGMVRFWSWEAFAHGAEVVSYFRYRQCPFAQEQMHAGLHLPNGEPDDAAFEAQQVAAEVQSFDLQDLETQPAAVALVFDYASDAALRIQAQGVERDPLEEVLRWYGTLRRLGVDIDIVPPSADVSHYQAVVFPQQVFVEPHWVDALRASGTPVLLGPRSGSKEPHHQIPERLPPDAFQALIPLQVTRVESLPPQIEMALEPPAKGCVTQWRERVRSDLRPIWRCADGWGVFYQQNHCFYLAAQLNDCGLKQCLEQFLTHAGVPTQPLPEGLRLRRRGAWQFAFHYGPEAIELDHTGSLALGPSRLEAGQLAAWRCST